MLDFALSIYERLPERGNLVWSPYSVASALALAAAGAYGATRDEIVGVLGPTDALKPSAELTDAEIAVANSLWTNETLPLRDEFAAAALEQPGGALHTADFARDAEGARRAINADVAKTTHDLIKNLLTPGTVDRATRTVLVNALYLKVAWLHAFPKGRTIPMPFHAPSGRRRVPAMRQTERMPYAEARGWRRVTLPTVSEVGVDLLLPGPDALSPAIFNLLNDSDTSRSVAISVPRFRVEFEASLGRPLGELGIRTAFTDDADFSGITPDRLKLDQAIHKAVLSADEDGFEGAAATAMVMVAAAMIMNEPVTFTVDRPFLVLVRHRRTGVIYFMARVEEL